MSVKSRPEKMSCQLDQMPDEILLQIMRHLITEPLLRPMLAVNKRFQRVALDDLLWRQICEPYLNTIGEFLLPEQIPRENFRQWYMDQVLINRQVKGLIEDPTRDDLIKLSELGMRSKVALSRVLSDTKGSKESNPTAKYFAHHVLKGLKYTELFMELKDTVEKGFREYEKRKRESEISDREPQAAAQSKRNQNRAKVQHQQQTQTNRRQLNRIQEQRIGLEAAREFLATANRDYVQPAPMRRVIPQNVNNESDYKQILARLMQNISAAEKERFARLYKEKHDRAAGLFHIDTALCQRPGRSIPSLPDNYTMDVMLTLNKFVDPSGEYVAKLDRFCEHVTKEIYVSEQHILHFLSYKMVLQGILPHSSTAAFRTSFMCADPNAISALALSCIYTYVARKFNLNASPVILPYKIMVRVDGDTTDYDSDADDNGDSYERNDLSRATFIDVERGGVERSLQDIHSLARFLHKPLPTNEDLKPAHLPEVCKVILGETGLWLQQTRLVPREFAVFGSFGIGMLFLFVDGIENGVWNGHERFTERFIQALEFMGTRLSPWEGLVLSVTVPDYLGLPPMCETAKEWTIPKAVRRTVEHEENENLKIGDLCYNSDSGSVAIVLGSAADGYHVVPFHEQQQQQGSTAPIRVEIYPVKSTCAFAEDFDKERYVAGASVPGRWFKGWDSEQAKFVPNRMVEEEIAYFERRLN